MLDQLLALAKVWSDADGRSLARLATMVVNRGSFFDLIQRTGATCTVDTVEKFLAFFRDGSNWPDGRLPHAATELLDNFANFATEQRADSPAERCPSAGKSDDLSPRLAAGAR